MNIGKHRFANGRRGANICQTIFSLSHECVNTAIIQFANGHRGANICRIICYLLTRSTIFCDTVEPTFRSIYARQCSQKRSTPRGHTDRQFKASGFSLLASRLVWELSALEGYLNGPQQKGNSNRVFQKILTQNIVELLGEGHLLLFSGLWLGTNSGHHNIQQPALPAQASPSSAALPAQPEPGAHHLPVSVHAFAVFFNRITSCFVIQELGAE